MEEKSDAKMWNFHGALCCLFREKTLNHSEVCSRLSPLTDYGDVSESGTTLHMWDDGGRRLMRCSRCGALFLYQRSEYHSFSDDGDDLYCDWFQVDSKAQADMLNQCASGFELETRYRGPYIFGQNGRLTRIRSGREE